MPFALQIEDWYARSKRDLPWRHTADPYKIWVSEVILQQTQVAQGLDYYRRFLERFPDVRQLALASEDDVLHQWQGLGYYSRARNMHQAAKQILEQGFPNTYAGLLKLKGVGEYTAAAIASIAFGQPHAVVDGNVYRVLSRYLGDDTPIDTTQGRKLYRTLAHEMLDKRQPALYNQAIMDFGAMVCTPKSPACLQDCPLAETCSAFRSGIVDKLPCKAHRTKVRQRHLIYIYVRAKGHILLSRRQARDIWQGLYQPPLYEDQPTPHDIPLVKAAIHSGAKLHTLRLGLRHQLSHQLLSADLYLLDGWLPHPHADDEAHLLPEGSFLVPETERSHYAVPRLVDEMYKLVDFYNKNLGD